MKTKLALALFLLTTLFINDNLYAQTGISQEEKYPETVVIKLIESYGGGMLGHSKADSRIITIKPDNAIESVPLELTNILNGGGKEEIESNLVKLRIELQKWHNNGFQVKSTSSNSPGPLLSVTTIILTKN